MISDASDAPSARWSMTAICSAALVGLAQVLLLGYQLGVGNQGIQIALLKHWANPSLFAGDAMVIGTSADYPSFFFRALAPALGRVDVPTLYLSLQLLTAALFFVCLQAMTRAMFRSHWTFWALSLLLLCGHHRALGGDDFYSPGFTHTWAVLPLAVGVLAMLYRGRSVPAMLLIGLTFNLHALTAAYLAAIAVVVVAVEWRTLTGLRLAVLISALLLPMCPTLAAMGEHRHVFDEAWIALTRIRSADHSFPSSWWAHGSTDIPRFVLIIALAAVAWSWPMPSRTRRVTLAIALTTAAMCAAGFYFSEQHPWAIVLRAQLFRSTRLLLIVALAHIAHGVVCAIPRRSVLEWIAAATACAALALPPLANWMAAAVAVGKVVAVLRGRLHWISAALAAAALGVAVLGHRNLGLPLPPASGAAWGAWPPVFQGGLALATLLFAAGGCYLAWRPLSSRLYHTLALVVLCLTLGLGAWATYRLIDGLPSDDWVDIQKKTQRLTRPSAVVLTPSQRGGFRIHSDRAIVGEWRDGTQAYFNPDFGQRWLKTMHAIQPGMLVDHQAGRLVGRGADLATLGDEKLLEICQSTGATHLVLPAGGPKRQLRRLDGNPTWSLYAAEIVKPPPTTNPAEAQERFLAEVVRPNIEKYRKGALAIQIVDQKGLPLSGAKFQAIQTGSDFDFGCSLPFFKRPPRSNEGGYDPGQVTQAELDRFLELFNASVIPFSAKWNFLEPVEGQRQYDDLDAYVDFCARNNIRPEYHFVSGYIPSWLRSKRRPQQAEIFLRHARQLAERYGDRIKNWQVVNERVLFEYSPAVYRELRKILPDAKLGLSNCAKFDSDRKFVGDRTRDMYQGLEEIKSLKKDGIQLDFFSFHGHRPMGWWMDARQMYECLDTFAAEGVKIHISEFTVPANGAILGRVRKGQWTPELQAEFYEFYYTVCFSHPAVEAVNLWGIGPRTWQEGSGLLDANFNPKPAFFAMKKLITETWRTRAEGMLGIDGSARIRGFHGQYDLSVVLPDQPARAAKGQITIQAGGPAEIRLVLTDEGTILSQPR